MRPQRSPCKCFRCWNWITATIPGGYSYDRFRDEFSARLRAIPAFREKLSDRFLNLDYPVWVEDSDFDIDRHVHRIGLPAPGGRAELGELSGHLAGLPLDRRRPLWEMWVIEGFGGSLDSGRLAVMLKVHHAAADGVTYANIAFAAVQHRTRPAATGHRSRLRRPPPRCGWQSAVWPGSRAGRCIWSVNVLPATVRAVVDTIRRAARRPRDGGSVHRPADPCSTAVSPPHRNVAFARLDLDDVKKVKNHFGVRVNDVAMALVSGVVRQFLLDRGELPRSSLVALVPVSVHGPSGRGTKPGVGHVRPTADADRGPRGAAEGDRCSEYRCEGTQLRRSMRRCCKTSARSSARYSSVSQSAFTRV